MKQSTSSTTRSTILTLLLILGSTLGTVFIGEVGLQLFYRVQQGSWLWENSGFRIGYTQPVEDRRQYSLRPLYKDEKTGISIDQRGFRETLAQEGVGNKVIICLGDSVPFGAGVRDKETYAFYLAEKLRTNGWAVDVINAGIPSYNLRQSLDRLRKDVFALYPPEQIVLVTIEAANDISLLTYYGPEWNPDLTWAQVRWSHTWESTIGLQRFAVFHYLAPALSAIWKKRAAPSSKPVNSDNYQDKKHEMLAHVRSVLHEELAFLQKYSIPVVLMPINPFYYQLSGQEKNANLKNWMAMQVYVHDWDELIRQYNDSLASVAKESDNAFFLETRQSMDALDRNQLYIDYIHHSPEGNRLVADTLFSFVVTKIGLSAALK